MGMPADVPGRPDQGDGHFLGNVERLDEQMLAALQTHGMVDEQVGKSVETGIVHGSGSLVIEIT